MLDLLKEFHLQIKEAMQLPVPRLNGYISNIVICGMGGSGIPGDILKHYLQDEIAMPIIPIRDYNLPKFVNKDSLVFIISYSGNTAETISAFKDAKEKKAKIIVITSNGMLKNLCRNCISIPRDMLPRDALAYLFFPILKSLQQSKIIKNKDAQIKETIEIIKNFNYEKVKLIARKIKGKIPVIYASKKYAPVAYRLKTQINENNKQFAAAGVFSEINHDEIEVKFNSKFAIILFNDPEDDKRIIKQINAFRKIVPAKINEVNLRGGNMLAKTFYGIHFGDYLSYYLSKLQKRDIDKTERIDKVKRMIE